MNRRNVRRLFALAVSVAAALLLAPKPVFAHCDGMDGPVVKAGEQALATENVNLVLMWVQPPEETTIKTAFEKTLAVRKLSPEAKELADLYFFETLVRIHRAGEGEPYTGLKPAGRDLGPVIPAADKAVENGSVEALLALLPAASHAHVRHLFQEVTLKKGFPKDDVRAGREYVKAYVTFLHEAEGLRGGDEHGTGHLHGSIEVAEHGNSEGRSRASEAPKQHTAAHAATPQHQDAAGPNTRFTIPQPLKLEHEELHAELVKATQEAGEIGEAAKVVAKLLHPHFVKEEEYALPPLGLLAPLAEGTITPDMTTVISMTDKLKADLPHMLQEHQRIVAALETLAKAAGKGGKPQYARFAEKLTLHAQTEEQVLYPAAILVGEFLKLKNSH